MTTSPASSTLTLLDTNVLVYAVNTEAEHHSVSKSLLARTNVAGSGLCVAPQNLVEFYAIVTNPRRIPKPVQPAQALQAIRDMAAMPGLALLTVPVDVLTRWTELLQRYPVTRQHTFDAFLVATMLGNGVRHIFTFNVVDFECFPEIEVRIPGVEVRS